MRADGIVAIEPISSPAGGRLKRPSKPRRTSTVRRGSLYAGSFPATRCAGFGRQCIGAMQPFQHPARLRNRHRPPPAGWRRAVLIVMGVLAGFRAWWPDLKIVVAGLD
jgi:hypothetical protein